MPYTPKGYKRLKNGLLKKSNVKRKAKRKQSGKGHSNVLKQVNSAMKKVNDAKKVFGSAVVNKAVKELSKGKGKVAKLLKGSGLRRAGAGLKRAGIR